MMGENGLICDVCKKPIQWMQPIDKKSLIVKHSICEWPNAKQIPIKPMETLPVKEDIINKPNHYHKNEIDVHGYLEKHFPINPNVTVAEGFYMGNIIKYVSRHKEKNGIQDLKKAMANLQALIELEEKQNEPIR